MTRCSNIGYARTNVIIPLNIPIKRVMLREKDLHAAVLRVTGAETWFIVYLRLRRHGIDKRLVIQLAFLPTQTKKWSS